MKKFIAMLLALVMVLTLVACGDKEGRCRNERFRQGLSGHHYA